MCHVQASPLRSHASPPSRPRNSHLPPPVCVRARKRDGVVVRVCQCTCGSGPSGSNVRRLVRPRTLAHQTPPKTNVTSASKLRAHVYSHRCAYVCVRARVSLLGGYRAHRLSSTTSGQDSTAFCSHLSPQRNTLHQFATYCHAVQHVARQATMLLKRREFERAVVSCQKVRSSSRMLARTDHPWRECGLRTTCN